MSRASEIKDKKHRDFYQRLRLRIRWWERQKGRGFEHADLILLAPDLFHLLCKLMVDSDVPLKEKAKLAAVIAYFISPVDLVPEAILGPVGYIDDVALAAYALDGLINRTSPEIVRRHWAGSDDVLDVIRDVVRKAHEVLGAGLWKRLRGVVGEAS